MSLSVSATVRPSYLPPAAKTKPHTSRAEGVSLFPTLTAVTTGSVYCAKCVPNVNRENLLRQAKLGQIATHRAIAETRRSATQAKQAKALRKWDSATLP